MAENREDDSLPPFLPPPPSVVFEPLKPTVNAAEVFLLCLCIYSGLVAVFSGSRNPVDQLLGRSWAVFWAVAILGGGFLALLGVYWWGKAMVAIGLIEIGYAAFAFASLARGAALTAMDRPEESFVIWGFAIAAFARIYQLEKRIRKEKQVPRWVNRWWERG
jgi:hypothetical protein